MSIRFWWRGIRYPVFEVAVEVRLGFTALGAEADEREAERAAASLYEISVGSMAMGVFGGRCFVRKSCHVGTSGGRVLGDSYLKRMVRTRKTLFHERPVPTYGSS